MVNPSQVHISFYTNNSSILVHTVGLGLLILPLKSALLFPEISTSFSSYILQIISINLA